MNKKALFKLALSQLEMELPSEEFQAYEDQVILALQSKQGSTLAILPFKPKSVHGDKEVFPLTMAIEGGSLRCVEALINAGAFVGVVHIPGKTLPQTRSSNMEEWAKATVMCHAINPRQWMHREQRFLKMGQVLLDAITKKYPLDDAHVWQKQCLFSLSCLPTPSAEKFLLMMTQLGVSLDKLDMKGFSPEGVVDRWKAMKKRVEAKHQAWVLNGELGDAGLSAQRKKM